MKHLASRARGHGFPLWLALLVFGLLPSALRGQAAGDTSQGADAVGEQRPAEPQIIPPTLQGFVEASLPADLDLAPGNYAVTLILTIDELGVVTEVLVKTSDAAALDGPAIQAARGFGFTPARVDGQPVPVQITYRYTFDIRPKLRAIAYEFELIEKGRRRPLESVTAFLEENGRTFTSDAEGILQVSNVAPGRYTLYVPEGDFDEVREAFEVQAGEGDPTDDPRKATRLYLRRRSGASNQTLVRAPREVRYVARQSLTFEELRRMPGSAGDPLKAIQNLPGISRPPGFSGQLVVFGSPGRDSQVFLEGMPFYQLYHFGALYSVINPEFIDRIDFVPAGFDATFGDAIGGIVDIKLKEDDLERWRGSFDINLIHAQIFGAIPYDSDGDEEMDGYVKMALRRSYIDALLEAFAPASIGLTTSPRYYDYQAEVLHRFSKTNRLQIFINGTDDRVAFVSERPVGDNPELTGDANFAQLLHSLVARWSTEPSRELRNQLTFQAAYQAFEANAFDVFGFNVNQTPFTLRDVLDWRATSWLDARFGVEGTVNPSSATITAPMPNEPGQVSPPLGAREILSTEETWLLGRVSPFVSFELKPFQWWTLVPSLRTDLWLGYYQSYNLDPRLSMRFDLSEEVAITAAGGVFHQLPFFNEISEEFGNPNLDPNAAIHALLGVELRPHPLITLSTRGFFKWQYDLSEAVDDRTIRYDNSGEGRAYGADFLFRVDPGMGFFGWVSYTLVFSERYNFDAREWQVTTVDQRHMLNALASYELGRGWSLGARFRLATGYPKTPVDEALFDSDVDQYAGLPNTNLNSSRMPAFHSLDVRVDKEWTFNTWVFALYLEVQNVYNNRSPEGLSYNYDFTESTYILGLPILPVLGVRGEF